MLSECSYRNQEIYICMYMYNTMRVKCHTETDVKWGRLAGLPAEIIHPKRPPPPLHNLAAHECSLSIYIERKITLGRTFVRTAVPLDNNSVSCTP